MEDDNPHDCSLELRALAVKASHSAQWELARTKGPNCKRGLGPLSVRIFNELLDQRDSSKPPLNVPKKLAVYIAKWTARLDNTSSITDADRSGRPGKVPQSVVDCALRQVRKRYRANNPYTSLNDAAHSAYFKHVLKTLKITIKTLCVAETLPEVIRRGGERPPAEYR